MATKTLPLSVRVTQDDAEFISNLELPDAVTPSDKIRAIIREAKERNGAPCKDTESIDLVEHLKTQVREQEIDQRKRSDLVLPFLEWLSGSLHMLATQKQLQLEDLEEDIAAQIFRLFNQVARLAITTEAPCYNPKVLEGEMEALLEITEIINKRRKNHDQ